MVEDKVSNFINGIKNAQTQGIESVKFSHTNFLASIADSLKREGFIVDVDQSGKGIAKSLTVMLGHDESGAPRINGLKRVSKQSKRVYKSSKNIFAVKNGYGTLILSTPSGIMTDRQARKANVGGEALFEIW
jgi:small subunit ribosomal protein S8